MSLFTQIQTLAPQKGLSILAGHLTHCRIKWLKNALIRLFIHIYKIDLEDAASSNLADYPHFNAFFTRHLKSGLRTFPGKKILGSPVDGVVSQCGKVDQNRLFQAKGKTYTLDALLTEPQPVRFQSFITLYLSPRDYHRVHMPLDGVLTRMLYVPGKLFSVNPQTVLNVDELFAKNERLICWFDTPKGKMVVILVGAMLVGSMATSWAGLVCPPHGRKIVHYDYQHQPVALKQGEELGYFQFGSTVIVLTEWSVDYQVSPEQWVALGQGL